MFKTDCQHIVQNNYCALYEKRMWEFVGQLRSKMVESDDFGHCIDVTIDTSNSILRMSQVVKF